MRTAPAAMAPPASAADPSNPLEAWRVEQGLSVRKLAARLDLSNTWVGRFLLPSASPDYVRPSVEIRVAVEALTEGVVGRDDWAAPQSGLAQ